MACDVYGFCLILLGCLGFSLFEVHRACNLSTVYVFILEALSIGLSTDLKSSLIDIEFRLWHSGISVMTR